MPIRGLAFVNGAGLLLARQIGFEHSEKEPLNWQVCIWCMSASWLFQDSFYDPPQPASQKHCHRF